MTLATFTHWGGWDALLAIATVGLATATWVLVAGLLIARNALKETRNSSRLAAYVGLLREYRSIEMLAARKRILDFEYEDDCTLEKLPLSDGQIAEMVSNYLDQVGALVRLGDLDLEPAEAFLGGSALNMWEKLWPIIRAERAKNERRTTYQVHFEYLVMALRKRRAARSTDRRNRGSPDCFESRPQSETP
jgi:hypothetical protein